MRNGRNSCLCGEELVSYIYDELAVAERASFERHLLDCNECTSEFAGLSMSRLGVYEWQRDEFVPLETPRFAIPYEAPSHGWFDAVRAFLSPARLSFAAAGVVFAVAASAFIYTGVIDGPGAIADINDLGPNSVEIAVPQVEIIQPDRAEVTSITSESSKVKPPENEARPVAVKTVRKPRSTSPPKPVTARRTEPDPANAPRLSNYDEVEDTSLRLADLVADIDTNE